MSFNWNVYKLFKNGKRAKSPVHTFTYEGDLAGANTHFSNVEIKNLAEKFGEKIKKFEFKILNSEQQQEREN